ncbi:sporulation membrane protein YtaF [Romboutsia sp.]|uniref:sporulation membrane protein YtaF n=1 Tax=Romboutsia sp. TaxID=1965302 RepID=UPI002C893CC9|nr:sporulation membrane protein YtaF [Romboutsia sp.]HSQ90005.1 sporulation membrane protein YtaF [Romboutsia sp.]
MLQSLLLVFSLCIDTFVASIAYGTDKIKIPFSSALIINAVCSSFLAVSLFLGSVFKDFLSPNIASVMSFSLLLMLGVYRLFESIFKTYIQKVSNTEVPLTFKVFDFKFVLEIYANETKADYDKSKILTSKEAFYLAVALSLDSLAVGFGSSLGSVRYLEVILLSLVIGISSLLIGSCLGSRFAQKVDINLSWLSGAILIVLALMRFL